MNDEALTIYYLLKCILDVPDSSSETVLQWCGPDIKYVNLGKPGIDTSYLSNQRARQCHSFMNTYCMYKLTSDASIKRLSARRYGIQHSFGSITDIYTILFGWVFTVHRQV